MNQRDLIASLRGLAAGIVGGAVGFAIFWWMANEGYYAYMLPGAGLGLAWGFASRHRSYIDAAICGILGLALGVFSDWWVSPFIADASFSYFVKHLHELPSPQILMIAVGGIFAAWFGAGRDWGAR